jgi:alpha-L-fucosidase
LNTIPDHHRWFAEARYGMFIHWGPYSAIGRGEQVLFREHLDQRQYERDACAWNPQAFHAQAWAQAAVDGGYRYAVLTTRHHDGYCLWDSKQTDYTSVRQAPKRDFVREYVDAFRDAGLRVGLYYSLADWRTAAYWNDPADDPDGWASFRGVVHEQVRELLTDYGQIDVLWFDGAWPHSAKEWDSEQIDRMARALQSHILVNNRLDSGKVFGLHGDEPVENAGHSATLGDFGTPEHHITPDPNRLWESCQTTTHRLWGYATGEHWRTAEQWLDFLCESASQGGNLLLNVGPDGEGRLPQAYIERNARVGDWLRHHGEAIYATQRGDVGEFITRGYQTRRDNTLYLIMRFWPAQSTLRIAELDGRVERATLLHPATSLRVEQDDDAIVLHGLPADKPCDLYPVIRLDFAEPPQAKGWAADRLWQGDPRCFVTWAQQDRIADDAAGT